MNKVNSFTFYFDYYNLIDTLPIEDKKELAVAILDYVFKDEMPNLKGHNLAIFNTLSHQLNLSKTNSINGRNGGAPLGNNNAEKQPKNNRKTTEKQSNEQAKNKLKTTEQTSEKQPNGQTKNKQNSILSFKFLISNFIVSNFKFLSDNNKLKIENKIIEWIKYKQEKNKPYKEQGLKSLLRQIENKTKKYGVEEVIDLIDECMANNYQGIVFDKLKTKPKEEKRQVTVYEEV